MPNHHRRSIRLRGYDYTWPGAYFVTICTHNRKRLFDDPALRIIAEEQWRALERAGARGNRPGRVSVDAWVVMPDHVHGIIVIAGGPDGIDRIDAIDHIDRVGVQPHKYSHENDNLAAAPLRHRPFDAAPCTDLAHSNIHPLDINVLPGSLGAIVRSYKAAVARRVNRRRCTPAADVWQRGYYERIVRNARELDAVRRYIASNPARHAARLDALLARMDERGER